MKRNRGWSGLSPYLVYFRKGQNEYKPEGAAKIVEPANAPKDGRWLVFERQPVMRYQDLPNQGLAPPPKPDKTLRKLPNGWAGMSDVGLLRSLLA